MGKVIQLITKGATEQVSTVEAGAGRVANTLIIKAQPGVKYELRDAATKFAPQQLLVIRQGKDLWIKLEDGEEDELNTTDAPDIIIENYYEDASGSLIGLSEDGEYYDYAPQEGTSDLYASNMDDGEFSYQSLGYADLPGETNWVPLILGALWLGGLALASNDDDTKAPDVFNPPEAPDAPDMTDDTDTGASNTDNNTADSTPDFEIAPPAEGETPNLYIDGELVPSTFDPVNNIITPVDPLPDGPHTVTVTVTDSHGESPQSPGLDIIIDTTPPALTALLDPASDSGVVGDGITNDTTPTISGTGEEGAAIRVVINGETLTTTVDSGGNWSVTPTVPLDDGSYTAAVSETDIAGNTTTADVPVVIDTTVNTVSIEGIDEDTDTAGDFITTDGDGLTVYASLSSTLAADEQLWYSNDNGATWIDISSFVSGTDVSYHDDALTSTTTVMMKVEDTAGNSAEDSQLITINTVPGAPTTTVDINSITVDSGIVGDFITNDNDGLMIGATLSAPLAAGETLWYRTDGGAWIDITGSIDVDNITVNYYDSSLTSTDVVQMKVVNGTGDGPTASQLVTIDTTADNDGDGNTVAITGIDEDTGTSGTDFITNDMNIFIRGTVDLDDGNVLSVTFDGTTYTAGTDPQLSVDGSGNWTLDVTGTTLTDDTYPVVATVTDIAGNTASATQDVVIDTTVNTVSIEGIDEDTDTAGDFITTDGDGLTVYASLSSTLAADEQLWYSNDNGATWIDISSFVSGTDVSYHDDALTSTTTVMMKVEDTAGNSAEDSQLITINTVPGAPTTTVDINSITVDSGIVGDFITNDNDGLMIGATLSAPLAAGETLWYRTDGGAWIDITGSIDVDNITVNYYDSSLTSTDVVQMKVVNGTGDGPTASQLVTIDTTADNDGDGNTVAITGIDEDTGTSGTDFITNDTSIFIRGTVDLDDGNVLSVTFDGTTYTAGTDPQLSVDGSGNWTLDMTGTTLTDDTYPVVATVTDIAGNTASATQDVVIDTTVNTVSIEGIDEDTDTAGDFITTDGDGLTVYASLSSGLAVDEQLWYSNDNGATWTDISSFVSGTDVSYHDDALTSTTTVIMKVEDTAGNSAEDSQLITINTVPGAPTTTVDINSITVDSGIMGDFITNDNDGLMIGATLSAPLAAGETLWYRTDGGAWIDITGSIGVDNITVNYYDSSLTSTDVVQMKVVNGTGDGPTAFQLVTIDTTAPLAPTVAITEDINNDGYINAGELSGNVDVRITLPSGTVEGDTVNVTDGTTPQTFVLTGTDITNGYIDTSFASPGEGNTITVTATVTDIAGNTGPSGSDSAVLETAAPAVINATANVSEEGLSGAASDMTGTPADTTNAATVSGTISISDASGISSVAVSGPAGLTSGGVAVTWSGSFAGGVYTLTGMAGTTTVATLTLDTAGAYTFTLLEPFDHPVADAEDILALGFSVTATDIHANTSTPGTLTINVEDDMPLAADSKTFVMEKQPDTAEESFVVSFGADGGYVSEISFDGATYTYDIDTDTVTPSGSSPLVESWSFNADNDELTINTTLGETFVVDMHTGEYSYAALGADEQVGPEVNVNPSASLLGIANAEALGLIDIGTNQMFTATDANNDIEEVIVRADSAINIGLLNYYNLTWSEEMAAEFGLNVVETNDILNLILLTTQSYSQLTITSIDGGPIDNLQLNEFLATVYVDQTGLNLLSLGLLPELSITATDSLGNSDTDTEQDVLGLSLLAPSGSSANIIEGTGGDNGLNGGAEDDRIYGYGGNDTLNGGEGNDLLRGGSGNDTLNGNSGNDILIGGKDNDTLSGGSGNDTFIWEKGDEGTPGSPAADTITDFNKQPVSGGGDILKLGGLLQGELGRGNTAGNLTDYMHFVLSGEDTILYISTTGGFSGGFNSGAVDQQITFTGVDLIGDFTTDEEVIAQLLANGNLVVDQETTASDQLNGVTTFDAVIVDNDGDTASTSVTFDTRDPAAPIPGNVAPVVQDDATSLLGLVGLNLLDLIDLESQAFAAADENGNLRSVVIDYVGTVDVSLEDAVFTASQKLAEELGLTFTVVSSPGVLGLVAPTSTITITALDGGNIDNQAVNELLATVRLESSTNLLGLVPTLDVTVLGSFEITATDSEGLTTTESVTTLANANVLEGLLGDEGNPDIIEGTAENDTLNSSAAGGSDERLYGHEGDDTIDGGDGNDLIRGGAGNDTLNGGDGNDILIDGNGADTFSGGAGDDWIVISDTSSFVSIDGGTGTDTLFLSGSGMTLDLSGISGITVTSIEKIDLEGTGDNALILSYSDLLDLSESSDILYVTGDSGDRVTLSEETFTGTDMVDGITYNTYDIGGTAAADIWVQQGVTVL